MTYEWERIDALRSEGQTWPEIAESLGYKAGTLRKANSRRPAKPGMKVLGIDIETAPNTAHVWGLWKQNIGLNQILQTGRVMCFAARWLGDRFPTVFHSEYHHGHQKMIEKAHNMLCEADAVVHYNGTRFDMPTLNREFISYEMPPPDPYAQVDLLLVARKRFRFTSNRLDHLLKELNIGEKVRHDGHTLWIKCMNGDKEAWDRMEEYNRGDVDQLEALYKRMLPWISNHPNHALYQETHTRVCPNCGGQSLQKRGFSRTKTRQYQRLHCTDCGTWSRERYHNTPKEKQQHILTQDTT